MPGETRPGTDVLRGRSSLDIWLAVSQGLPYSVWGGEWMKETRLHFVRAFISVSIVLYAGGKDDKVKLVEQIGFLRIGCQQAISW
jgi:hypothetical protein